MRRTMMLNNIWFLNLIRDSLMLLKVYDFTHTVKVKAEYISAILSCDLLSANILVVGAPLVPHCVASSRS